MPRRSSFELPGGDHQSITIHRNTTVQVSHLSISESVSEGTSQQLACSLHTHEQDITQALFLFCISRLWPQKHETMMLWSRNTKPAGAAGTLATSLCGLDTAMLQRVVSCKQIRNHEPACEANLQTPQRCDISNYPPPCCH